MHFLLAESAVAQNKLHLYRGVLYQEPCMNNSSATAVLYSTRYNKIVKGVDFTYLDKYLTDRLETRNGKASTLI